MRTELTELMRDWALPEGATLQERIDAMILPAILSGCFIVSPTAILGSQYHLGGEEDTRQLAKLAAINREDSVLDVCSYLGGPALQLAESYGCRVVGIDISEDFTAAARGIAELAGLANRVTFEVADARAMPFEDGGFSVVWSQGSLSHHDEWLREFDRVLAPSGRLALTFAIRRSNPDASSPKWTLDDVAAIVAGMGYSIDHLEDITDRDIEFGWNALGRKLSEQEALYESALGADWVRDAHAKFANEARQMREGRWGNGRMIAKKAGA